MNTTTPVDLVKTVYDSLSARNIQKLRNTVTDDVTWNVTEGFPHAGIYRGIDNVLRGFYAQLVSGLSKFDTVKMKWIDAGNHVIVLGYYLMRVKNAAIENKIRFAHIWEVKGDKVAGVWQVADTAKLPDIFRL